MYVRLLLFVCISVCMFVHLVNIHTEVYITCLMQFFYICFLINEYLSLFPIYVSV